MAQGRRKRRGYVRQYVSPTEKAICGVILVLMIGIAGAIVVRGTFEKGHLWGGWDKSRYIPPTAEGTEGPGGTRAASVAPAPEPASRASEPPLVSSPEAPVRKSLLTPDLAGPGWKTGGEPEFFPADRLWEKINGHAELFLQYEVVSLEAMTYQSQQDETLTLDVHIYDMGMPLMAFGVYSSERPFPLEHPVEIGREGYQSGGIYFWKGPYYTAIIPSVMDDEEVNATMFKMAQKLADRQPDQGLPIWGETALPKQGRIPHSLKYLHQDALGVDFMPGVYTAQYGPEDDPIEVFLTDRGSPQEAQKVFDRYIQSLRDQGTVSEPHTEDGATVVVRDMEGLAYDFVFQRGSLIGGVRSALDRAAGEAQLKSLLANLPAE